jgi:hypothetical protein
MPGLRRPVVCPGPVSALLWLLGFSVVGSDHQTVGALTRLPRVCGSPPDRPDAVSIRPSWPGCWRWNVSRVASWRSLSWISRSRRPVRSVGRCMGRFLGAGGSRPPGSRESHSKLRRSVGSWRDGGDRPISSWHWRIGPSSASPGSRPPEAWMSCNGPGWSPSIERQAGHRLLQSWTLPRRKADSFGGPHGACSLANPDDHDRHCNAGRPDGSTYERRRRCRPDDRFFRCLRR